MQPPTTTTISFPGPGGVELAGRLHAPAAPPRGVALFAHCFSCGKDIRAAVRVSQALVERGFAVLRFDFMGLGESAGDFADGTFTSNVDEVLSAAAWLRQQGLPPTLLIGHSLGGAAVLAAAARIEECRAVATIGAPAEPLHVRHLIDKVAPALERDGEAEISLGGRPFRIRREFLTDLATHTNRDRIAKLGKALLVLHAPSDAVVGIDNAQTIYVAARHPKSFVSLDDADHMLSRKRDAQYAADVIAAWASRYLPDADSPPGAEPLAVDHGSVVVRGGATGFRQHIQAGKHMLSADEPVDVGGTDTGPSPYQLLLSSLGACTSMTLRLYADRKGWPLAGVDVHLDHEKRSEDGQKVDVIARELTLHGPLADEQRARLLEIAQRCPVHRTLHGTVRIEDNLT